MTTGQGWAELPEKTQDAIRKAFPGLAGPSGAAILWKTTGGATEGLPTATGFEGGRLIATVTVR